MAQDRGRKGRSSGRREQGLIDETLQVRVRRKNPLIERKASAGDSLDTALASAADPAELRTSPSVIGKNPPHNKKRSIYDEDEGSDTTQEFEQVVEALSEEEEKQKAKSRPRSRPRSSPKEKKRTPPRAPSGPHFDEDATEIADGPPRAKNARDPDQDETDGFDRKAMFGLGSDAKPQSGESPVLDRAPRSAAPKQAKGSPKAITARSLEPKPTLDPGAVPRHLLGKWGTDAVGAAAQRANIARIEQSLPQARSPAIKMVRSELTSDEIGALETALAGTYDERGMEPSLSPKRSLEHLINESAYNELSISERGRLLKAISGDPRDVSTTKAAIALLKTGVAKRLRLEERDKLFALFVALTSETRALLARLAARPLRNRSALEDRDFKDSGLVTVLHELATQPIAPEMEQAGVKRGRVLTLVMTSLAHPERLPFEEGSDGVLSMLEFSLADAAPAELARLWLQLVTRDMCAELAGESELDLAPRVRSPGSVAFSSHDTPLRVALESLAIQARPRKGLENVGFVMPGGHGVDADVISRALTFVFGAPFTVAAGAPTALRHLLRIADDPHRVPPIYVTILYERGERVFVFDHLDDKSVYLRAPHGRSSKRKGAQRNDPPRTVEDPDTGIDTISREELEKLIGVALIPRSR